MSDANNPENKVPPKSRFSLGLLHQAGKGKFSTRKSNINARAVISAGVVPPSDFKSTVNTSVPSGVDISYKQPRVQSGGINIENMPQEALSSDRISIDQDNFFSATTNLKELRITASAAKSLTRLFSALAKEPGSGNEVPANIRSQILGNLIRESHVLANDLCISVMGKEGKAPLYLRAKLLQQSAEFLSDQWIRKNAIDPESLKEMARRAFSGEVDGLNQEVVDLFHHAGEFTPATTEEISKSRITEAVIRASWSFLKQVQEFDLRNYDTELPADHGHLPFSYGRDPYAVTKDLTVIALKITKENELHLDHLDLSTNWTQNSIDRATSIVRSEYQMMTDRALRSSFKDELFSEAAINHVNSLYDQIMERIASRARNGFIVVERNAIDAMSATSYVHYLPKNTSNINTSNKVPANISTPAPTVAQKVIQESAPVEPKEDHYVVAAQNSKQPKPFSFLRRQKAV